MPLRIDVVLVTDRSTPGQLDAAGKQRRKGKNQRRRQCEEEKKKIKRKRKKIIHDYVEGRCSGKSEPVRPATGR